MKLSRLSITLILTGFVLLLSSASESVEPTNPKEAESTNSPTDQCPADCQTPKEKTNAQPPSESNWDFNRWLVILTGGLVGVGIAQVYVYIKQGQYMRQGLELTRQAADAASRAAGAAEASNRQSREMAEKELRAYVSVDSAQITGVESGHPPVATLVFKNSGLTPAYDLTGMGGIGMEAAFDSLPPAVGSPRQSKSSLPPGTPTKWFHLAPRPLIPEETAALRDGTMTLWVYGEIRYRDAFGIDRFTRYRFQIGGGVGIQGVNLAVCEEGNEEN
jgi:uncharacterized protein (UPF0333 family)